MGRLFLALAAVGLFATVASAAVKPPVGNAKALAFYTREANIYAKLPGAKVVETGYFFGHPIAKSVGYMWGHPPDKGYAPQTATILMRLNDNKIVAYYAELTGPHMRHVRIAMSGGAVFVTSGRCWNPAAPSSSPFGTGENYLFNNGGAHFAPLTHDGSSTSATFTYVWAAGARAREVDTWGAGPKPTVKVSIDVTGSQRMSINKTITPLTEAPELPIPAPPAQPAPKPLCRSTS